MTFPGRYWYICTFVQWHFWYYFFRFLRWWSDFKSTFSLLSKQLKALTASNNILLDYCTNIQKLNSDGVEGCKALEHYFGSKGFRNSFSQPYTPEHIAIAERNDRSPGDSTRLLLTQASLSSCFWPFAMKHGIFIKNRVLYSATKSTGYLIFND